MKRTLSLLAAFTLGAAAYATVPRAFAVVYFEDDLTTEIQGHVNEDDQVEMQFTYHGPKALRSGDTVRIEPLTSAELFWEYQAAGAGL